MPWSAGDEVVVLSFGSKRGRVVDAAGGGRYRVRVEGIVVACREADLADPPAGTRRRKAADRLPVVAEADAAGVARLDLHGLTVEEAMERVLGAIDRTIQNGASKLEIVHGKGTGRIKSALHRKLADISVVKRFAIDPHNPGVTWVWF